MRVLIADDEPVARQVLRELLSEMPDVELVGEAATGSEALEQTALLRPDVILLDLEMPELDGFRVARALHGERMPAVIFVTAYADRAVDAFEVGAAGYVLKPVSKERLAGALGRVRPAAAPVAGPLRRIAGRRGDDFQMVDISEVIAFHAESELVYILTAAGRLLANQTLRSLDQRLPQPPFRRVHRKTIINTDHIRRISPLSSKRWLLRMSNGLEVIVSKRMAGAIREQTHW